VQERLRQRRELIPNFIEEMLRLESPIKGHFRMARRTTILGGITIPAGTSIMLVNGAANRDPRRFESPCEMRFDRPNVCEQLAFSRGAHSCIGQSLARSESRITIERVLDRMADFRVSDNHHGPARHDIGSTCRLGCSGDSPSFICSSRPSNSSNSNDSTHLVRLSSSLQSRPLL
jgi:cytochrome P450